MICRKAFIFFKRKYYVAKKGLKFGCVKMKMVRINTNHFHFIDKRFYLSKSQGFKPVCFLNAAEKCEIEE